jgi:hypothetical protein
MRQSPDRQSPANGNKAFAAARGKSIGVK